MFLNESAPQNGRMPERTHAVNKCTCTRTATCGSSESARKRNSKTCTCTCICRNESAPQFKIYARRPDVILPEFCRGHLSSGSLVKVSPLGCLFSFSNFIQHICVVFKISLLNDNKFTRWRDSSITCANKINFLNNIIRSSQFRFFFLWDAFLISAAIIIKLGLCLFKLCFLMKDSLFELPRFLW